MLDPWDDFGESLVQLVRDGKPEIARQLAERQFVLRSHAADEPRCRYLAFQLDGLASSVQDDYAALETEIDRSERAALDMDQEQTAREAEHAAQALREDEEANRIEATIARLGDERAQLGFAGGVLRRAEAKELTTEIRMLQSRADHHRRLAEIERQGATGAFSTEARQLLRGVERRVNDQSRELYRDIRDSLAALPDRWQRPRRAAILLASVSSAVGIDLALEVLPNLAAAVVGTLVGLVIDWAFDGWLARKARANAAWAIYSTLSYQLMAIEGLSE